MNVTVVIPCFNEVDYIYNCVQSLIANNNKIQFDVLVVDGRSTDGTVEILKKLSRKFPNVEWLTNEKRTVPYALNMAIKNSSSEFIVRVDAHCTYPNEYISILVSSLQENNVDNVGGVWVSLPSAKSNEAVVVARITSDKYCVGNAEYRIGVKSPTLTDTVPFGCYRKSLFERIGYFDEEMTRNQDDELNSRIIKHGGKILLIPDLKIIYYCRPTIRLASKMFFQYALFKPLGNFKSGRISTTRQLLPPLFLVLIGLLLAVSIFSTAALISLATLISLYFLIISVRSILLEMKTKKSNFSFNRIGLSIKCYALIHVSYGLGYIKGIYGLLLKNFINSNIFTVGSSR